MKRLFSLLLCAACAPALPPMPEEPDDTCNAAAYAGLIGQRDTALERVLILAPVRIVRPNTAVTMDFLAERINFIIDEADNIVAIQCG